MPPQSRGGHAKPSPKRSGYQSKSTPNLPTLRSLAVKSIGPSDSPEKVASLANAFPLDSPNEHYLLSPATSGDEQTEEDVSEARGGEGEQDASEEDDLHVPLPTRPLYHHHPHSRSHTYLAPSAFAPPFYNRPPTPLPPSPSLTSLLRPAFSSQSRPTTPDHSSDEGPSRPRSSVTGTATGTGTGTQTPNSAAASTLTSSFRTARPIERASPKVPTYEYYGFTLYLTSSLAFLVYLLWAFLPAPFLHSLGIYYYPNRWWALAIPAWTVMFIVYIYVALAAYNTGYLTLPLTDVECLVDEAANVAVVDSSGKIVRSDRPSWRSPSPGGGQNASKRKPGKGKHGGHSRQSSSSKVPQLKQELDWRNLWREGTDAVMDIPIGGVCEILYGLDQDEDNDYEANL